jgi:hypothetical protein
MLKYYAPDTQLKDNLKVVDEDKLIGSSTDKDKN